MCGFAVLVSSTSNLGDLSPVVERMTQVIRHRGPDDEGTYFSGPVGMGFRRLSILDISPLGHQPMLSDDGQVALVFNGEIYNYLELRAELAGLGHAFKSTGDTEVLLRAYLQWGVDCVRRFNGMWAFVIHDRRSGRLFGSRDRFGIKPLYRSTQRGHVMLASEIKCIRASGLYEDATNWKTASRYILESRLDDSSETFYSGIEQIPPATAFEIDENGKWSQWRYWTIETQRSSSTSDPATGFAQLFEDAVRLHMRSDVPVGVHLSGGLDSTSIICASARLREAAKANGRLMAFSYITKEFDESRYILDTIAQTRATLVSLESDPQRLWSILAEVLKFQDEPIYSMMPLVGYELMRLTAANGIKVILNGQGADETLAGYPSYFGDYWCSLLSSGALMQTWREIGDHVTAHGGSRSSFFSGTVRRLIQSQFGRSCSYRRLARAYNRRRLMNHRWFTQQLTEHLPREDDGMAPADLNASLIRSIYSTPLPRILRIEDRNAMAHSIESRLPFLDYRLVSFAFGLAEDWHMRGKWNKYVLREAMRGSIPESVRVRVDKMGFPVPANKWLAGILHEPVLDVLLSQKAREKGIYKMDAVIQDVERHRKGEADLSELMFDVAQFELWSAQ